MAHFDSNMSSDMLKSMFCLLLTSWAENILSIKLYNFASTVAVTLQRWKKHSWNDTDKFKKKVIWNISISSAKPVGKRTTADRKNPFKIENGSERNKPIIIFITNCHTRKLNFWNELHLHICVRVVVEIISNTKSNLYHKWGKTNQLKEMLIFTILANFVYFPCISDRNLIILFKFTSKLPCT